MPAEHPSFDFGDGFEHAWHDGPVEPHDLRLSNAHRILVTALETGIERWGQQGFEEARIHAAWVRADHGDGIGAMRVLAPDPAERAELWGEVITSITNRAHRRERELGDALTHREINQAEYQQRMYATNDFKETETAWLEQLRDSDLRPKPAKRRSLFRRHGH